MDSLEVAAWRYEQIAPLMDEALTEAERSRYLRESRARPVEWPLSDAEEARGRPPAVRPVSPRTLRRWLRSYREGGLLSLVPKTRSDKGTTRSDRSRILAYALALLYEEPKRSLSLLLVYISLEFPGVEVSSSTLNRDLNSHPAYQGVLKRRSKRGRKLRDLYQADYPHQLWQLDGKGPFLVRLEKGDYVRVHVLSVLDAFSRYVLALIIAKSEDIAAAVCVTRMAMRRWGMAEHYQFDRGSAFDSWAFRGGLALLGTHRKKVKAKDPESQGLIEAYHRCLVRWFVQELRHQVVVSLEHLQELLWATNALVYNKHYHRVIKMTPEEALAGRSSKRRVGEEDLLRAFWVKHQATSHPKTGIVRLPNGLFRVPSRFAGSRHVVRYDPVEADRAVLVLRNGDERPLSPYEIKSPCADERPAAVGTGQLQRLCDVYKGAERPNAQPGFGLPEVFRRIGEVLLERLVPADEREAETIRRFYREFGPLPRESFQVALEKTRNALGAGRALRSYLDFLARLIRRDIADSNRNDPEEIQ